MKPVKGVFLISLGCTKNLVDSEHILGLICEWGWPIVSAMEEADHLLAKSGKVVDGLAMPVQNAADAVAAALSRIESAVAELEGLLEEDSHLRVSVSQLVNELTRAARSFREAADYIERHPESLLRGKRAPRGK